MSLEAALDEERREVMNILEGRPARSGSPAPPKDRPASPAPPVRSMLDISSPAPRHGPIAGAGAGITSLSNRTTATAPLVRSLLDPQSPPPNRAIRSATTSPTSPRAPTGLIGRGRSTSEAANQPVEVRRREEDKFGIDIHEDYQFDMLPSIANQAMPKRVAQGGKKGAMTPSAMAAVISGNDLSSLPLPRGRNSGRHNSTVGIGAKSKSPSSRLGRAESPGGILNTNSFSLMSTPGKFVTDSGKLIDMDHAYRRLSDAALLKSGGSLSGVPSQNIATRERVDSGESLSPRGGIRLQKDYYEPKHENESVVESSDDADEPSSADDEWMSDASRGRRRSRKKGSSSSANDGEESEERNTTLGMGRASGPRKVKSLMAAAEEERMKVSSRYKVNSLLEPSVTITSPAAEKLMPKKSGVHPNTSFDYSASGLNTPATSDDDADMSDIKRAQRLGINMSHVDTSVPNRAIRTILRGDFAQMQEEIEEGHRRARLYLVATDLSDEAIYALEWTIGTILRDGDTLFAIYAVDEESGTGKTGDSDSPHPGRVGEGARLAQDARAVIGSLTERTKASPLRTVPQCSLHTTSFPLATEPDSHGGSTDSRNFSKIELERLHAVEDITQTCVRLLRKTRLQVRVAIECIHCKSPKHLITEAIDNLEPTLVVLGSRGRSALKGVLLGSFSNYLVTKSSVPVMVARKKLRKHAKFKSSSARLSNNLINPKRLATAKID